MTLVATTGLGVWRERLFWPWRIQGVALVLIWSPLSDFRSEMESRVYILGEVLGAALLLWDIVRRRFQPLR